MNWKNSVRIFLTIVVFGAVSVSAVAGGERNVPSSIKGSVVINADDLVGLIEKRPEIVVVDSRLPTDRRIGFIEGSINVTDDDTNCDSLKSMAPRTEIPVVFYCNGERCPRSGHSVNTAVSCGYKNVYWFRGGMDEWKAKNYPYVKPQQ